MLISFSVTSPPRGIALALEAIVEINFTFVAKVFTTLDLFVTYFLLGKETSWFEMHGNERTNKLGKYGGRDV